MNIAHTSDGVVDVSAIDVAWECCYYFLGLVFLLRSLPLCDFVMTCLL